MKIVIKLTYHYWFAVPISILSYVATHGQDEQLFREIALLAVVLVIYVTLAAISVEDRAGHFTNQATLFLFAAVWPFSIGIPLVEMAGEIYMLIPIMVSSAVFLGYGIWAWHNRHRRLQNTE